MHVSVTRFKWLSSSSTSCCGRQLAIVGHALVMIVRDEIVDVFLEIGAGAADGVNFVLPNHFSERNPQFGRAHGARERHEHLSALGQMGRVGFRRVDQRGRVEVAKVMLQERRYGARDCRCGGTHYRGAHVASSLQFKNENTRRRESAVKAFSVRNSWRCSSGAEKTHEWRQEIETNADEIHAAHEMDSINESNALSKSALYGACYQEGARGPARF